MCIRVDNNSKKIPLNILNILNNTSISIRGFDFSRRNDGIWSINLLIIPPYVTSVSKKLKSYFDIHCNFHILVGKNNI